MTQEDLGFEANLDRTYISLIERGEANITVEKLAQLASALNVPCFELIKPL
ncbi:MAG: helix-turn-helix transcriptional regulator [Sphingomonadales bacterium]|nr:helix-turn-helix transcriptional regulator [Sphingomonadales bacterium]